MLVLGNSVCPIQADWIKFSVISWLLMLYCTRTKSEMHSLCSAAGCECCLGQRGLYFCDDLPGHHEGPGATAAGRRPVSEGHGDHHQAELGQVGHFTLHTTPVFLNVEPW